jgi:hypothetical protein
MPAHVVDLIGGGEWNRTDLRVMSRLTGVDSKGNKGLSSAESGKIPKNPQPPRNQILD